VIGKLKQKIRYYLTEKYDMEYFEELDQQVSTYHNWIEKIENEKKTEFQGKGQNCLNETNKKSVVVSYGDIISLKRLKELFNSFLEDTELVILAEGKAILREKSISRIENIFETQPLIKVLYTDEDEVNSNGSVRLNPWLKPDYSPDTLLSYFYFGSLVAVRKEVFATALEKLWEKYEKNELNETYENTSVNDLQGEKEGKTNKERKLIYALVLEVCNTLKKEQVYHLKEMLCSSHAIRYWGFEEEFKEIREYYDRLRHREEVEGVSIVIPSKDNPEVLERCLKSIAYWTKNIAYEIIVIDNGSKEENKKQIEKMQESYKFSYLYEPMEFNFSKMCNQGAAQAKYGLLLFLNDDCEVRGAKWLSHMAALATVQATGAVGAKLYYPESKRLQHCGIYNIHLGPVHKLQFKEDIRSYYDRRNLGVRNVLAVTAACLMVRKSIFEQIGGFDENLQVAFNDVDFCYRLYEEGYQNVIDNDIHLWHHESLSRGSDESPAKLNRLMLEKRKLYEKHKELWANDPYYHPFFSTDILDTGYSFAYEYPHHKYLAVEKPAFLEKLPKGVREENCVAPMIEYAGDLEGWFLEPQMVNRIKERIGTGAAAFIQGTAVVLGSDNACFTKKVLLRQEETGACYQMVPESYYRPDVFVNLQDQENVALSGFSCLIDMSEMPKGKYEIGIMMTDKISGQSLLRITTRSIENK